MAIYPSGSTINNRYEVVQGPKEKPTLAGGMGLVYLCVDHGENGRPVALKTFRPEYLPNREARDRFLREGTIWVELGYHSHIVRCYEVIKTNTGSDIFFVLELIGPAKGKSSASLRSWLTFHKPFDLKQTLLFALHLVRGMKYATEKIPGLVHRDLKPENILVGQDNIARITDFGLAIAMQREDGESKSANENQNEMLNFGMTQSRRGIVGTPLYMSPEQWAGEEVDERTDIYAFGCILYEMLTGQQAAFGRSLADLERAHRTGRICKTPLEVPLVITKLVQKCVAINRQDRYQYWSGLEEEFISSYQFVTGIIVTYETETLTNSRVERLTIGWSYNDMGLSYRDIGKFEIALKYFNKVLSIGQDEDEREMECAAVGNLGETFRQMGNYRESIRWQKKSLEIAREIGDQFRKGLALGNLGCVYADMGKTTEALSLFNERLLISREIGHKLGESQMLGNIANLYFDMGKVQDALKLFGQELAIIRELGNRQSECQTLLNLGGLYIDLNQREKAIEHYDQALLIARSIGDRTDEGRALGGLGNCYRESGDVLRAIEYYNKEIEIMREIGNRHLEGWTLGNLGICYLYLQKIEKGINFFESQLTIAREIGDRLGEGKALGSLANAYSEMGDLDRAVKYCKKAISIMKEINHKVSEAGYSFNLAKWLFLQRRYNEALPYAEFAAATFTEAGNKSFGTVAQELLEHIRISMTSFKH